MCQVCVVCVASLGKIVIFFSPISILYNTNLLYLLNQIAALALTLLFNLNSQKKEKKCTKLIRYEKTINTPYILILKFKNKV